MKYIIALDQGTTSCRAILFNEKMEMVGISQREFTQIFPEYGWVEHNPNEIWDIQMKVFRNVLQEHSIEAKDIIGIGITNQRETTVVWDAMSGEPLYNAIVWQDNRTASLCEDLRAKGLGKMVKEKTGLVIDSYFSATKIHWILENVKDAKKNAQEGNVRMGTIDSWLLWKLTNGKVHATDYTNASRTMLYNIKTQEWDEELLEMFHLPKNILPKVFPSTYHYADFEYQGVKIPILGIAGDQQAALFGQSCIEKGDVKNTYGTGCFMLQNLGNDFVNSQHGLITTMACSEDDTPIYAFEGSIFVAGAAVQWLRDSMKIIDEAKDSFYFSTKINTHDIIVVPAFSGLGAPYWNDKARGAIFGLTRETGKEHIIKATLESIAYQTKDVLDAMQKDSHLQIQTLMVDGGATANTYLMQFQADILGIGVDKPVVTESTALGVALLVGLKKGSWKFHELKQVRKSSMLFKPKMDTIQRTKLYKMWQKGIERTVNWIGD